jgi:putative DNA primase/helicase
MTPAQRKNYQRRLAEIQRQKAAERKRIHAEARKRARQIWRNATAAPSEHPYLRNKGVAAYGIRSDGQRLILPLRDSNGRLHTLHFIDGDGSKRNLAGGRVLGCYHLIGEPNGTLCICEGYGTGASVHDATGHAVAVAVSTSNLKRVAEILRDKYPRVSLVLCADNDQWTDGNPGVDKAIEAALAAEANIAIPHFKNTSDRPTDFNDLMRLEGLKAVRKQLARASKPKLKPETTASIIKRLAALPTVDYDRVRKAKAERLGVRVTTLDKQVAQQRKAQTDTSAGQGVMFDEVAPWSKEVDGASLLQELTDTLGQYLILPRHAGTAIALWVLLTHTLGAATVAALLVVTSPEKRCGKTTVLRLLNRLCYRPLPTSNISPSALFRSVEKWYPTLLIDENDTFHRQSHELRGIINSGHERDQAYVIRNVGDTHEPRKFSTWGAKAIARIGDAADTNMDRAIVIRMRRKLPSETVKKLRHTDNFDDLKACCVRWAADHLEKLKNMEPELPPELNDRAADNWLPLIAIADAAGGKWPTRARKAARALSSVEASDDASQSVQLLADIKAVFEALEVDRISSVDLVRALVEMEDRP